MNNFLLLFIVLLCLILGVSGASIIVANAFYDPGKNCSLLQVLSWFGDFLGGMAGGAVAVVAYLSLNTWQKQLEYGKHIALIWDCTKSIRELHLKVTRWRTCAHHAIPSDDEYVKSRKEDVNVAIEELESMFIAIDTIIVRNESQWANYIIDFKKIIAIFDRCFSDHRDSRALHSALNSCLSDGDVAMKDWIKRMNLELEALERQVRKPGFNQ